MGGCQRFPGSNWTKRAKHDPPKPPRCGDLVGFQWGYHVSQIDDVVSRSMRRSTRLERLGKEPSMGGGLQAAADCERVSFSDRRFRTRHTGGEREPSGLILGAFSPSIRRGFALRGTIRQRKRSQGHVARVREPIATEELKQNGVFHPVTKQLDVPMMPLGLNATRQSA